MFAMRYNDMYNGETAYYYAYTVRLLLHTIIFNSMSVPPRCAAVNHSCRHFHAFNHTKLRTNKNNNAHLFSLEKRKKHIRIIFVVIVCQYLITELLLFVYRSTILQQIFLIGYQKRATAVVIRRDCMAWKAAGKNYCFFPFQCNVLDGYLHTNA